MNPYNLNANEVLAELNSSKDGLSLADFRTRRNKFGPNKVDVKGEPLWKKLLEPFLNVMMLVLVIAAAISLYRGEIVETTIILAVIAINAVISWTQIFSTERILRKLRATDTQKVSVKRAGKVIDVMVTDLVSGDIIYLSEGEKVPADARIITSDTLSVNESMLTGESLPVSKISERIEGAPQVYDQKNMLFSGSFILSGSATAVVVQTGNYTQFGNIAQLVAIGGDSSSPVQKKINKLIRQMVTVIFIVVVITFVLAIWRGIGFYEALSFVLALAVSAVPEGLPVAITVILVLGMRRMAKQKALVRNMRAIENIGEVTVIATDKTGTLTKNELSVQDFWSKDGLAEVDFQKAISYAVNNTATKNTDPLDIALDKFAKSRNKVKGRLLKSLPFNYDSAMSGNVWQVGHKKILCVKGAPEKVLAQSNLSSARQKIVVRELHAMTRRGERVIAFASAKVKHVPDDFDNLKKQKYDFIGFVGIADSLRAFVGHAVDLAENAGIDVKMITGDHAETAEFIADEANIGWGSQIVFDATKLDSQKVSVADVKKATVFARVIPETKFKILEILKKTEITAMTGDGVNDVPALTKANIGISMGSGTQIAKDASDIILLNDNFRSIVECIRESRVILENIKRMIVYLVSTNIGEIIVSVGALLIGLPLPLTAVQILWVNLVTDSFMVIPLGLEPDHGDVMNRKPNDPRSPILNKKNVGLVIVMALTIAIVTLGVYIYFLNTSSTMYARSMAFFTLIIIQLVGAWVVRSLHDSVFTKRVKNRKFVIALIASIILQSFIMFTPAGRFLFNIYAVNWIDLIIITGITFVAAVGATETYKFITRSRNPAQKPLTTK